MWYKTENGLVSSYDILELRILSKTVKFCQDVDESELDVVVEILLDDHLSKQQKADVIASAANILLINRQLHIDYFIPKYATTVCKYCIGLAEADFDVESSQYLQLIPLYRILFLTIYGGLDQDVDIDLIMVCLDKVFAECVELLDVEFDKQNFQLLLVEIFKCFYTLYHKHQPESNKFFDECLKVINTYCAIDKPTQTEELVIKNAFNFLLLLCGDSEDLVIKPIYSGPIELYKGFFANVKNQLVSLLETLDSASTEEKTDKYPVFINLIVVLKYMSRQMVEQLKQEETESLLELHSSLADVVLPTSDSKYIYNQFLQILAVLAFPNLGSNHTFPQLQQLGVIKDGIVTVIYDCCYNKDRSKHHALFFELVGFLNSDMFMEKNGYLIDPSIELQKLTDPITEHLDKKAYFSKKLDYLSQKKDANISEIEEMTEEEKELEAEKLFVVFERMEKLGTFGKFKNPIRQWQQEGKFEEIKE